MTPDLLAAAERLRRIKRGDSCEEVYYGFASLAGQHLLDYTTVGDALTDETPIDESWLRSMGWGEDQWGTLCCCADDLRLYWAEFSGNVQCADLDSPLTTRGSVTALLFALGATK